MPKSGPCKTKRSGGYFQRQLNRIVNKLTDEDCKDLLQSDKQESETGNK